MDKSARYIAGVGRRKTAVAIVRLTAGKGHHTVNDKPLSEYFGLESWRERALGPIKLIGKSGKYDISARVSGGGISAQADAISLGIARALLSDNEELKPTLKKSNLLTRDARGKERRKYGLKKARKAPQFSKR